MGKLKWYEGLFGDIRYYLCWLFGHGFKYEPMDGDTPPFEFSHCQHCGKKNPTYYGGCV